MAKRFSLRRIFLLMSAAGAFGFSQTSSAAAFALWEQDAASIGNYHAGTAASADDASTAWYNPAGLIRIKNQQAVLGADPVLTNFKYNGTVVVNTIVDPLTDLTAPPMGVVAQGGGFNLVPFVHYAAPITDRFVFGFSVDVPFGLKTNYGNESYLRYGATLTQLEVVDITPSFGVAFTDKFSMGAGLDIQRLSAELNQIATLGVSGGTLLDTRSHNAASDTGYGWRIGALYQFTPCTRVGVNYRSKVTHHATGNSTFSGPLAIDDKQYSRNFHTNATLPAVTSVSVFHTLNPCWDLMSSITYTQWSVFKDLVLQNVAGINEDGLNANNVIVTIPNRYSNAWNYAIGANYHPSEKWIIRTGAGYDQTPSNDKYRNLQIPDADRIAIALGAHYQINKAFGMDAGWTHIFAMNTRINNLSQQVGPEIVTTNGEVTGSADVYGLQLKWDIL